MVTADLAALWRFRTIRRLDGKRVLRSPRVRLTVGAIVAITAGCGGEMIGKSAHGDRGGARDSGALVGSGGAPETGPAAGSGGALFLGDASVRGGSGGTVLAPSDEAGLAKCHALVASARSDVTAAISLSCADDSECTLLTTDTDCSRGCPVPGRPDSAASVAKAIAEANQQWCGDFRALGCFLSVPECLFARSVCSGAQCHLAYSDFYRFDITNLIDSGETAIVTKLDGATGACVVAEFFITAGDAAPRFRQAWFLSDARSCCPAAAYAVVTACNAAPTKPCHWPVAAPNPTGTAHVASDSTLDVDYSFSFPAVSQDVAFSAKGLVQASCGTP
jgi:hypothetical protein